MILIGISGKKRSGKNTVASILQELSVEPVQELAFADDLKNDICKMLGVCREEIENDKAVYREMLQAYGVYMRVKHGDDYWVERTFKKIVYKENDLCIITDVRFPNEAKFIQSSGGYVIRVVRDAKNSDNHISETAMDNYKNFDAIILNTGSLDDLVKETKDVANKLKIKIK